MRHGEGVTGHLLGAMGARLVLIGAVVLTLSGCSKGSAAPGVANLGTSKASTTVAGGAGNSGAPMTEAQLRAMTAFAGCVRKHGLPAFPDPPYSAGELNGMGFRKNSPAMERATKACHGLALKAGVVQTPAELQQHLAQMLKIAKCMRAHGITDFPDPDSHGNLIESPAAAAQPGYAKAAATCDAPPGSAPPSS